MAQLAALQSLVMAQSADLRSLVMVQPPGSPPKLSHGAVGSQECGFSRLQNLGVKFSQHAKIFHHAAKNFETDHKNFLNSWKCWIFVEKKCLDMFAKNAQAAKNFPHHAKIFAWGCKNHFLQPRKPGLVYYTLRHVLLNLNKHIYW